MNTSLNVGDIVDCTVEQIMPYGAFVKITENSRKGMIHISELSYNFVKDINEILKIQDKIKAKVIKVDDRGRIDLSLKQATEPPAPSKPKPKFSHDPKISEAKREIKEEEADAFEKKMASFLKTSEAKITDLNSWKTARSGRTTRRRNNNN